MSYYLNTIVLDREQAVEKAIAVLSNDDFDTIAVSGVSGLLIGPILAYKMGKKLMVIRKDGESTHSSARVEGTWGSKYVIIDDFIGSGKTVKYMREQIEQLGLYDIHPSPVCVGFYGYHTDVEPAEQKQRCAELGLDYLNAQHRRTPD